MLKPTSIYLLLFASFCHGTGEKPSFLMTSLSWFRIYHKQASFVSPVIMSLSGPEINVKKAVLKAPW